MQAANLNLSESLATLFELPTRVHPHSAWIGHIPFLFLLIKLARPRNFVELGVHYGTSFLAACDAVKRFETGTHCYGIDTWKGDSHAGFYDGDPLYENLRALIARAYNASELIRSTFDEAVTRFSDCSIDLLHIDGLHTYEAVAHDFNNWRPKLSDRSIVMFHDTEVHERGFGVCRLWSELKQQYRSLDFQHAYGLGVLATGRDIPAAVDELIRDLSGDANRSALFKDICEGAGATLPARIQRRDLALARPRILDTVGPSSNINAKRNDPCPCGSGKRYKHCHGRFS